VKKAGFLLLITFILGCGSNGTINNCFPFINMNETIDIDLPQYLDLQVPSGHVSTTLSGRRVIIIRRSSTFQAFDLKCPEQDCSTPMSFDGLKMKCPCDNSEYNSLNGSALTEGFSCFAKEYLVEPLNGSILRISNF